MPEAQYECGQRSLRGAGVKPSSVRALSWFRKAADLEYPPAEYEVGRAYFEGSGVAKDVEEGLRWVRIAADHGFPTAQNKLGLCYMKGEVVEKDLVQAYKWFNIAAGQGLEGVYDIRINLAKVETQMTKDQVAEAQRLSREFKPKPAASATKEE